MKTVFRCFVEKKPGFDGEAKTLERELREQLGLSGLTGVRVLNRYDVEGVSGEKYLAARTNVLTEPQVDFVYDEEMPANGGPAFVLAVEAWGCCPARWSSPTWT